MCCSSWIDSFSLFHRPIVGGVGVSSKGFADSDTASAALNRRKDFAGGGSGKFT